MKDVKVLWADGKRDLALRICQNAPGRSCSASVIRKLENTFWVQYEKDSSGKVGLYELAKEINYPWRKPFEKKEESEPWLGRLAPKVQTITRRKVRLGL